MFQQKSLRFRIFLSMTCLVLIAFAAIAIVVIFQYQKQATEYHQQRLIDKENQIKSQIQYALSQTTYPVETAYIPLIFRENIYKIANIQNVNFDLYDLEGNLLKSSRAVLINSIDTLTIPSYIIYKLQKNIDKRFAEQKISEGRGFQTSFSYVNDLQFKPIAILSIPYFENDSFNEKALKGSLYNLSAVYVSLLILALFLAYFLSSFITKSLKNIKKRLESTQLLGKNQKIVLQSSSSTEIEQLVNAYNQMIDEIEKSKILLAKSEREQAWREMAKQVAHEIKNPLTPMRLSVQLFQSKFKKTAENNEELNNFCQSIIEQIDVLSNISTAFSALTDMPEKNEEFFNSVPVIKRTLLMFHHSGISFDYFDEEVMLFFDKDQFIRIIINLVKNALEATQFIDNQSITISLRKEEERIKLIVSDNGIGISSNDIDKIFEPKFTTKSSGSGLGLAMVKNIVTASGGEISVSSQQNKGSVFTIIFNA